MALLFEQEGYNLIGAAMEVYNEMSSGFLEDVYQECMEIELHDRQIPFLSQEQLELWYKTRKMEKFYRPDLFVSKCLIVELKAEKTLTGNDEAQLLNYLKGARKKVGYLLNFGDGDQLQWKRMVLNA
jgi:GxxExxY protein